MIFSRFAKTWFLFTVITLAALPSAWAASSSWHDLGGGKGRIVATMDPATLTLSGAVEISLKPGWSTYWRYPGSTGIPPVFDFSGSAGVEVEKVFFVVPQLMETTNARYAGYKNSVLFPFEGKVDNLAELRVSLDLLIGVCEEICIPAKAVMKIEGTDLFRSDPEAARIIAKASLGVPKSKPAGNLDLKTRLFDVGMIEISLKFPAGEKQPELFVEGPEDWYLSPAVYQGKTGERHTFILDVSQAPESANILGTRLRYTLSRGLTGIEFEY